MVWTNDMERAMNRYQMRLNNIKRAHSNVPTGEIEDTLVLHESMRGPVRTMYEAVFGEPIAITAYRSLLEERTEET